MENSNEKNKPGEFYRWRLKWMPFINLTVIAIAIFIIFQLPNVTVKIIEPFNSAAGAGLSSDLDVSNPFTLRMNIDKTLGCDFSPSTIKATAKSIDGHIISMDNFVQDKKDWIVSNIDLPLGKYQLEVTVDTNCVRQKIVSDRVNINLMCMPISVAKAKEQGDVCGEYVADNCGGYVKLDSCIDFGAKDPRLNNEKLNCSQTGYYIGKSVSQYVTGKGSANYFTALKCGSGNTKDCYELPTAPGTCRYSKWPEEFSFYGSKDDPSYHKCRIECR